MQKLLYAEHYLLTHDVLPIAAKELTVGSFVCRVKPQQRSDDPMERQMAQALKRLKARCGRMHAHQEAPQVCNAIREASLSVGARRWGHEC